jgi:CelD/BcsL family acetyltransferase involved in cellulose biosynthesis
MALAPAWEALATTALEPSPSSEAWIVLASLRHALDVRSVRVVTVALRDRLIGVFPLADAILHPRVPLRVPELWNHPYAITATPLVDHELADVALDAFVRWSANMGALLRFPEVRADGGLAERLVAAVQRQGGRVVEEQRWSRAFFRPAVDAEAFIAELGSAHHRKEWRRQERRLREQGEVTYAELAPGDDVDGWLEAFLALEASGWKGREGTAFASSPSHRAWIVDLAHEAFRRGRLDMIALRLAGRPVAMRLSILSPPGAHAFKIAYDEELVRYSPGVLLELENIRRLHAMPSIRWMDSLAAPGHSLMERVWPGRATMLSLLVAPGPALGKAVVAALPRLRAVKRAMSRERGDTAASRRSDQPL